MDSVWNLASKLLSALHVSPKKDDSGEIIVEQNSSAYLKPCEFLVMLLSLNRILLLRNWPSSSNSSFVMCMAWTVSRHTFTCWRTMCGSKSLFTVRIVSYLLDFLSCMETSFAFACKQRKLSIVECARSSFALQHTALYLQVARSLSRYNSLITVSWCKCARQQESRTVWSITDLIVRWDVALLLIEKVALKGDWCLHV